MVQNHGGFSTTQFTGDIVIFLVTYDIIVSAQSRAVYFYVTACYCVGRHVTVDE